MMSYICSYKNSCQKFQSSSEDDDDESSEMISVSPALYTTSAGHSGGWH